MSENAPGQLLGFMIQFPRALCHLLRAKAGCTVCIEVHGDVATLHPDGTMDAEEDKSSVNSNPVTDKSTDLWKTFSNWVNAVNSGELDPETTTFILYRNKSGKDGLAEAFHNAKKLEDAESAINQAVEKLKDTDEEHPIYPYYQNTVVNNRNVLIKIILNFQLETGDGAGYEDVDKEFKNAHVPNSQIRYLAASINGWLTRLVAERISAKVQARITWEEFNSEFLTLFTRARHLELIDFTLHYPPSDADVDLHIERRPNYVQQVELINGDADDIITAVTDYLKAKINRDRWIEDDLIDEQLAAEFEEKLQRYWKNTQKITNIKSKSSSKEERGLLLYHDCMTRQETIRGASPPPSTIEGTYHALADRPTLGWHDDWEARFKKS